MKLKLLTIILAITTAPLISSVARAASDDAAIVAMEKQAWDAFKNKQPDAFKALMTSTYASVYANGIKDVGGELTDMKAIEFRSYNFTNTKVAYPTPDVAVLTYVCAVQASYNGKDISGDYNSGSVYVKQNGKWLGAFHTETKADK